VDKMNPFWVPPPLRPLPPWGGDIFGRICLINYGLIIKTASESQVLSLPAAGSDGVLERGSIKVFGMPFKVNRRNILFPRENDSIFYGSCFLACPASGV